MARRYVSGIRIRSDFDEWDADASQSLARTVHEEERQPIRTGLLDHHGNDIYAMDEADPIGFVRFSVE